MEFSKLPIGVQLIAAECLAAKINTTSLLVSGKNGPAKEQARQVKEAFTALYSPSESDLAQSDSDRACV